MSEMPLQRRPGPHRLLLLVLCYNFACYIFVYNGTEGSHRLLYAQVRLTPSI